MGRFPQGPVHPTGPLFRAEYGVFPVQTEGAHPKRARPCTILVIQSVFMAIQRIPAKRKCLARRPTFPAWIGLQH